MTVVLDRPDKAVGCGISREMYNMSSNCILLVYTSALRAEADTIHDYTAFVARVVVSRT